jgi:rhamnosyltransferase subunit B
MKRHFVITTLGTSGDIFPFIEMGKCLLSKSHKVSFVTNPYYEKLVINSGLAFTPFGTTEQFLDVLNDPDIWNPNSGFRVLWAKAIRPNIHSIRLFVQSLDPAEDTVIVSHPALMALANLARGDRGNVKAVLVYLYPTIIRSYFGRVAVGGAMTLPKYPRFLRKVLYYLADKMLLDVGIVPDLNAARLGLGMTAIEHFFPHLQSSADLYVTLFPEWYASTQPDYPKPLIEGDFLLYGSGQDLLSEELTEFAGFGRPPILFTAGTGNQHAKKFFEIAVDVVRELNVRAVFLTKFREQLPASLPDSVLWQEYAPFNRILPRVSAIVHHGGIGTVAEASRAGVPQLIVPSAYDQFDNALIIQDLGIGGSIPEASLTKARLLAKLSEILGSENIKRNCLDVSSRFRSGPEISQILDRVLAAI